MQSVRNRSHILRSSYFSLLTKQQKQRHQYLSTTNYISSSDNWNPVVRQRNADVGKHVFEAFAVRTLINHHPDLNAGEIHDVTQGLVRSEMIVDKMRTSDLVSNIRNNEDLFDKLGQLQLRKQVGDLDAVLTELSKNLFASLSSDDKGFLMKIQHPKFILKQICQSKNISLIIEMEVSDDGREYEVRVTCGEEVFEMRMPKVENSYASIEQNVCLVLLKENFADDFKSFRFNQSGVVTAEEDILLNPKLPVKREVVLSKTPDQVFGFTIRGGERKVVRDKEHIQKHFTSPIFISDIAEGSPAENCGLIVGDVLLGVSDHSFAGASHKEAATTLKRFLNAREIVFTVKHSAEEKLKYEAEERYLERQKAKLREEVNDKNMRRWHDAKAKLDPQQYVMEKLEEKKRPFTPKKIKKSWRLWDY